jgi:hypothetical protein
MGSAVPFRWGLQTGPDQLAGQCLDRRLADRAILEREVTAWQAARNQAGRGVNWLFTTEDARIKLKYLYPTTHD